MTFEDVQELFIKAAEIDRRLPISTKPASLKAIPMDYVHDDEDVRGWDEADKKAREWAWLDPEQQRITREEIATWEKANELVKRVTEIHNRRALLYWARAKAGGKPFNVWCRKEGIHPETGRRRKDRAISEIAGAKNTRNVLLNNENAGFDVLLDAVEMGYKTDKMQRTTWRDADTVMSRDCVVSEWRGLREARNASRRIRRY